MQVEKTNPMIGPQYWLSPFGINESRVYITHTDYDKNRNYQLHCAYYQKISMSEWLRQKQNDKKQIVDHRI